MRGGSGVRGIGKGWGIGRRIGGLPIAEAIAHRRDGGDKG